MCPCSWWACRYHFDKRVRKENKGVDLSLLQLHLRFLKINLTSCILLKTFHCPLLTHVWNSIHTEYIFLASFNAVNSHWARWIDLHASDLDLAPDSFVNQVSIRKVSGTRCHKEFEPDWGVKISDRNSTGIVYKPFWYLWLELIQIRRIVKFCDCKFSWRKGRKSRTYSWWELSCLNVKREVAEMKQIVSTRNTHWVPKPLWREVWYSSRLDVEILHFWSFRFCPQTVSYWRIWKILEVVSRKKGTRL